MVNWVTVERELKIHFRSSWTYTFVVMFSIFTAAIIYLTEDVLGIGSYTRVTGTLMNLLAYFLPLLTLVTGAFSLTMEKEDGSRRLLFTYPVSALNWVLGKCAGIFLVITIIVTIGFSFSGIIAYFYSPVPLATLLLLYAYAISLVVLFLAVAVLIGTVSCSRWQALTISVGVWLLFVLAWPVLFMSLLHVLSFKTSLVVLEIATLFNPVEFTRIFFTMKMGGGYVFGPQYVAWVSWAGHPASTLYFLGLVFLWGVILLAIAVFVTERSRRNGA